MTTHDRPSPLMTPEDIFAIERPDRNLMTYYTLAAIITGPAFPLVILPLFFRYHTMRYHFTEEGVSMRWGVLFRKEINLTFARIQDIHLTSNFVERWLGLARIQIQTASGSASAEMTIEGVQEFQALRDFLYARMRGAKVDSTTVPRPPGPSKSPAEDRSLDEGTAQELAALIRQTTSELRALRETIEARRGQLHDRSGGPTDG